MLTDCCNYTKDLIQGKIRDVNKSKSNLNDPHKKSAVTHPMHKVVFDHTFLPSFSDTEKQVADASNDIFNISLFHRACSIFDSPYLIKMKPMGDLLLVCPWMILNRDFCSFEKGRLVIPLAKYALMPGKTMVFIPSGGPDDLEQFQKIPVSQLFSSIRNDFPIQNVPLPGTLTNIAIDKKFPFFNAPKGELKEGDVFAIGSHRYVVDSASTDCFKPWSDLVSIGRKTFLQNNKKRPLKFGQVPTIIGQIVLIDDMFLSSYQPVVVHFKKQSKFNHGVLTVTYMNAIFNEAGYLTHDVAVVE